MKRTANSRAALSVRLGSYVAIATALSLNIVVSECLDRLWASELNSANGSADGSALFRVRVLSRVVSILLLISGLLVAAADRLRARYCQGIEVPGRVDSGDQK